MINNQVLNRIELIFHDIFDDDTLKIGRNTNATDIKGWDSLAQISLIVAFEKEFKIKFSLEELAKFNEVGDIVDIINKKIEYLMA
jgi:acyl carrier protein